MLWQWVLSDTDQFMSLYNKNSPQTTRKGKEKKERKKSMYQLSYKYIIV